MRHYPLCLLLLLPLTLTAQDLILTQAEDPIIAQIVEIDASSLRYRPYDQPEAALITLDKAEVQYVVFADGMKQYFSAEAAAAGEPDRVQDIAGQQALYAQGVADAREHYDNKAALWGTFGATIIYPLGGVVTGALTGGAIALVPPRVQVEKLPDPQLYLREPAYATGYRDQMRRRKAARALTGLGLGTALQAAFVGTLIALLN